MWLPQTARNCPDPELLPGHSGLDQAHAVHRARARVAAFRLFLQNRSILKESNFLKKKNTEMVFF